jgi:hypothetical protein
VMSGHVLIHSYYLPQPEHDSYSTRLLHFVEVLLETGCSVTCVATSAEGVDGFGAILEERGVTVRVGFEHVESLAKSGRIDVAILGFWYVAEPAIKTLRRWSPSTRVVVDSGDLHLLRQARRLLRHAGGNDGLDALDSKYADETVRELNVYAAADAVLAVSRKEEALINDLLGQSRAHFVPDCEDRRVSPVPFARRRGLFFVGHFQHYPNVEAVEFLCRDVLPQFTTEMLHDHPVYIAGPAMTDALRRCAEELPDVRILGWVPSITPYLEHARVVLAPLLHGAGTKRKVIQALATGTPTVSTHIGAEGLDVRDGEDILLADDPVTFANAIARLIHDRALWGRLARQGRDRVLAEHTPQVARDRLLGALSSVVAKGSAWRQTTRVPSNSAVGRFTYQDYQRVIRRTREIVARTVPADATVVVVSKGDEALLDLGVSQAWHFPRNADGVYAGHYPASSTEAIAHLEHLHAQGGDFLILPKPSFWWLEHYEAFKQHLESRYVVAAHDPDGCLVYSLQESNGTHVMPSPAITQGEGIVRQSYHATSTAGSEAPALPAAPAAAPVVGRRRSKKPVTVLVVGVYGAGGANTVDDIVGTLSESRTCRVVQRWAAQRTEPPTERVASATALKVDDSSARFEIITRLLAAQPLATFDYVLVCGDDIILPQGFLEHFLGLQTALRLTIARPGLEPEQMPNRPVLTRHKGVVARETQALEFGPLVSVHRSAQPLVFPVDSDGRPSGGSEVDTVARLRTTGTTIGIIDAVPVAFNRPQSPPEGSPVGDPGPDETNHFAGSSDLIAVTTLIGTNGTRRLVVSRLQRRAQRPRISVVIPTHNRAALLEQSLNSFTTQSLSARDFELIVVDDGSTDGTAEVCDKRSSDLPLTLLRLTRSGIAAAKNLGVLAANAPIVLFFDDDDIADEHLLAEHLRTHARYPLDNVAVLGYTAWAPSLNVNETMRYVTDIGHFLFNYSRLADGERLDFTHFWGGRTSCKTSLLCRTGMFDERFEFGSEDIEAGFRISKRLVERRLGTSIEVELSDSEMRQRLSTVGLAVIFNRQAIQYMNRAVTFDAFCRRCERQGRSQRQFSGLHTDPIIQEWCDTIGAAERWPAVKRLLPANVFRVHQIEEALHSGVEVGERLRLLEELHRRYRWTFNAFKTKGIVEPFNGDGAVSRHPTPPSVAGDNPGVESASSTQRVRSHNVR